MPTGSCARISSIDAVHGRIAENTCCSRIRRAISCVYCPPKSRTTIPCLVLNCPPRDRHARLPFLGRVALFVSPLDRHRERLDPPFRLCVLCVSAVQTYPWYLLPINAKSPHSPWTIFLYTNNYLRRSMPRCKDFIHILGLRLHARFHVPHPAVTGVRLFGFLLLQNNIDQLFR